ncbi:hypothetical protein [Kitasatospora sp. NPDC048407]|uniref:hypothetical protein n=1 Tax=Kitasatospora sp. NPDC048407 TaxID=3364051 RepID=UPI00371EE4FD
MTSKWSPAVKPVLLREPRLRRPNEDAAVPLASFSAEPRPRWKSPPIDPGRTPLVEPEQATAAYWCAVTVLTPEASTMTEPRLPSQLRPTMAV